MDLETLIPIVIIAVAYIYKAFQKAGKKENKPGQPASKPVQGPARPSMPVPKRVQQPVARNTPEPAKPASAEQEWWERELSWPSTSPEPEPVPEPVPVYKEPAAPKIKTDRLKPERMHATPLYRDPEAEEPHEYAEFDLQDAVIKSAILERREF